MLAAGTLGDGGKKIWGECKIYGFIQRPSMNKFMSRWIFEQIKHYIPHMRKNETRKESDPWWELISAVEDLN